MKRIALAPILASLLVLAWTAPAAPTTDNAAIQQASPWQWLTKAHSRDQAKPLASRAAVRNKTDREVRRVASSVRMPFFDFRKGS